MADAGAEELNCGSGNNFNGSTGLRIGGVFIILAVRQIGEILANFRTLRTDFMRFRPPLLALSSL